MLTKFYNLAEWKKAAKHLGYSISGPELIAGSERKAKGYYAWDQNGIVGEMINWGKGYCEGSINNK